MNKEAEQMTILLKSSVKKVAGEVVLLEVLLGIFNSFDYKAEESIEAVFDPDDLTKVHKLFEVEYLKALRDFLSLEESERNKILDEYITSKYIQRGINNE